MTAPDESARRRKIDAELRLQADPLLRDVVKALADLVENCESDDVADGLEGVDRSVLADARAALAKARGEE